MISRAGKQKGFTIVELGIVVAIIAILTAVTVVGYRGMQQRADDTTRENDMKLLTKALDLYYIDKGVYPRGQGSTTINNSWSTTADGSWQNLLNALAPYATDLPTSDPTNTPGVPTRMSTAGYSYDYFSGSYCGVTDNQMYLLQYRRNGAAQFDYRGACLNTPTVSLGPNNFTSAVRVVK